MESTIRNILKEIEEKDIYSKNITTKKNGQMTNACYTDGKG